MAQQMPLPLTVSCSNKSRLVLPLLVLPFWYLLTRVVPDKFQKSSKTVVCVCGVAESAEIGEVTGTFPHSLSVCPSTGQLTGRNTDASVMLLRRPHYF